MSENEQNKRVFVYSSKLVDVQKLVDMQKLVNSPSKQRIKLLHQSNKIKHKLGRKVLCRKFCNERQQDEEEEYVR